MLFRSLLCFPVTIRLKKEISNWSNSIPNSPIKNIGDHVEIIDAHIKEFYLLKLDTFIEIRQLQTLTKPFYGTTPTEQTIFSENQVDIWSVDLPMPKLFTDFEIDQTVFGSERVFDCLSCFAKGEIKCHKCGGHGKYRCSDCGGRGQIKCSTCDGKGENYCSDCHVHGIVTGKQIGRAHV